MVVLDALALLIATVGGQCAITAKGQPLHERIERLTLVGGSLDGGPEVGIIDVLQQEPCTHSTAQFVKRLIELVFAAIGPQLAQNGGSCEMSTTLSG